MSNRNALQRFLDLISELKAPKNQFNKFGGYKYRSLEDITEALKPLLKKYNLLLLISDEIVNIGDRFYIKANARILDVENGSVIAENTAFAREPLSKKGMDEAQITGASSSYARKYALNGLLCIDDTRDADATNDGTNDSVDSIVKQINNLIEKTGTDRKKFLSYFKVSNVKRLVELGYAEQAINLLNKKLNKGGVQWQHLRF